MLCIIEGACSKYDEMEEDRIHRKGNVYRFYKGQEGR